MDEKGKKISSPFTAQPCRESKSRESALYGASLIAVGTAAAAYHAASGKLRTVLRKADYYAISLSSIAMTYSLHSAGMRTGPGRMAAAASVAFIPFQPTLVTACHAGNY